jgi:hypothetical protein
MTTEAHTDHMSPTSLRPFPTSEAIEPYLDQLAHLVAEHGIAAFESDIARLVVRLRAAGHHGPMVDLLSDKHARAIARERAFGVLVARLVDDAARAHAPAAPGAATAHAA